MRFPEIVLAVVIMAVLTAHYFLMSRALDQIAMLAGISNVGIITEFGRAKK